MYLHILCMYFIQDLNAYAQKWADHIAGLGRLQHSECGKVGLGENIAYYMHSNPEQIQKYKGMYIVRHQLKHLFYILKLTKKWCTGCMLQWKECHDDILRPLETRGETRCREKSVSPAWLATRAGNAHRTAKKPLWKDDAWNAAKARWLFYFINW